MTKSDVTICISFPNPNSGDPYLLFDTLLII